jgi:integrase
MRLYKRKNGYWYYETRRNRPVSLQTKNKREAQQLYAIIKKEVLRQRLVQLDSDKRATLAEFKDIFFLRHADIGDKARDAYDLAMRLFLDSTGETSLIGRITEDNIRIFKSVCLARGCRKTTVNNYLRHLRTIFNKALAWGYITQTPKLDFYRIPKNQPRTLTKTEQKALLSKARETDPEMARIIVFALWTGCRRAEIAGLQWQHIQNNMAKIIGKGGKERTIPLLPRAIKAIGTPRDIGPVFVQYADLSKYTKAFKSIARSAGIHGIHFHNLRHTAATQMIESGIEIRYVQEMLGHSSVTTTEIYTKIVQKTLRKKMKKMKY